VDGSKLRVIGGWDVHVDGENVIQLAIGEERKIAFNTVDAGPGIMEARLDSTDTPHIIPNTEENCRVETTAASRSKLILNPNRAGNYRLVLKWGNFDIDGAPKLLYVHPASPG